MTQPAATSLDPADWDRFRAAAHAALDRVLGRLELVAEGPVWRPTPDVVRDRFAEPLPRGPRDLEDVLDDVDQLIAPFVVGNTHPKFFGWAHGAGTPVGVVAELIAAALDANCGGRDHIGPIVERQIALWAAEAFGLPRTSSGVFVTGASQANFVGLLVARDAALGHDVRSRRAEGRGDPADRLRLGRSARLRSPGDGACRDRLGLPALHRDRRGRCDQARPAAGRDRHAIVQTA